MRFPLIAAVFIRPINYNTQMDSDRFLPPHKADEHSQAHELLRYWRAVNRHRLGIILLIAATGALSAMYAFSLPAVYRSITTEAQLAA